MKAPILLFCALSLCGCRSPILFAHEAQGLTSVAGCLNISAQFSSPDQTQAVEVSGTNVVEKLRSAGGTLSEDLGAQSLVPAVFTVQVLSGTKLRDAYCSDLTPADAHVERSSYARSGTVTVTLVSDDSQGVRVHVRLENVKFFDGSVAELLDGDDILVGWIPG